MKQRLRITVLALLAVLGLTMTAMPVSAQLLYSNGPPNGTIYGWEIDSGFAVSDTFNLAEAATVGYFTVGLWVLPSQVPTSVSWSVTSAEFGGTRYGFGTYTFAAGDLSLLGIKGTTFIGSAPGTGTPCPAPGCDIYEATINIPGGLAMPGPGTYWLNLQNATATSGPVGWDENDGPSLASQNSIGTIPSEDPNVYGTPGTTPEPSSILLFSSGGLALTSTVRRKLKARP